MATPQRVFESQISKLSVFPNYSILALATYSPTGLRIKHY